MKNIKTKSIGDKSVKVLDKSIVWTERVKDPILYLNEKSKEYSEKNIDVSEYGQDKIKYYSNRIKDEAIYNVKKQTNKGIDKVKNKFKIKKLTKKNNVKSKAKKEVIKKSKKTAEKVTKESTKITKRMLEEGRKLAIKSVKVTAKTLKVLTKALVSAIKGIIAAVKSLVALLGTAGTVVAVIIIIICLVALLLGSVFGIFFSNEGNSVTMSSVISEVNQEVYNKIDLNKRLMKYDDYVIDSSYSNWREIIAVYSVKYNNSENNSIVFYINEDNISRLKNVFWNTNTIEYKINRECDEDLKCKNMLHIDISSKSKEELMNLYHLDNKQKEQVNELLNSKYDDLWNSLIYGNNYGEWANWRQKGAPWSNIKIGNTSKSIGDIGCLATSIAILIEKSGVPIPFQPFNPGTFVEAMNKNGGFDKDGNLYYGPISKVVPNFEYVGSAELLGKTEQEKFRIINEYYSKGYYLAIEVKGNSGGQHWVAVNNIKGNTINMVDPGSNNINLWLTYNSVNTSQIRYFKAKK